MEDAKDAAKLWGWGSAFGEVIKVLALYCASAVMLQLCWKQHV
jgi:hypothetical protein